MVAVKAAQAEQFIKSISADISAVLVFGQDAGLVSERATRTAAALATRSNPPGEVLRIDDADLEADPDRLIVELTTISMFGGRKIVRATAGRRVNAALLGDLIGSGRLEGAIVVEAGNLKPTDTLRAMFEKSALAAAIPCYQDTERDLAELVDTTLRASRMDIAPDAKRLLLTRLGADRSLSRSELEKLVLYCHGRTTISVDDVEAATGDASDLAIDMIVNAAAGGDVGAALSAFDRAIASGDNPQAIIIAAQRHFQRLHRVRSAYESTGNLDDALRSLRPPLHFRQQTAFANQVRTWPLPRITRTLAMIGRIQASTRSDGHDDTVLTNRLVLDIGRLSQLATESRNRP